MPSTIATWSMRRRRAGTSASSGSTVSITRCARGVGDTERRPGLAHGQVRAPVGGHQQHPVRQVQPPLPTWAPVGDRVAAALGHDARQPAELAWL